MKNEYKQRQPMKAYLARCHPPFTGLLSHRHFCTMIFQPTETHGSGHVILHEMPCIHKQPAQARRPLHRYRNRVSHTCYILPSLKGHLWETDLENANTTALYSQQIFNKPIDD